jgi:hypothetical protein
VALTDDGLSRQVRDVLTAERHALPYDLVSLDAVHRGADRRRRRRNGVAAAGLAAVVALVGVPVGLSLTQDAPRRTSASTEVDQRDRSPSEAAATPTGDASASMQAFSALSWDGAEVVSVTATSPRTLVVLGRAPGRTGCGPDDCLRIAATNDGGLTYYDVSAQPVGYGRADGGVSNIRFGSGKDAWLYGPGLWSSHDEGQTWEQQDLGGQVDRLAAAHGTVWALVGAPEGLQQLYRSPVGADDWEPVEDVVVYGPGDVATLGDQVVVAGVRDDVSSWVGGPDGFSEVETPCAGLTVDLSALSGVWARCTSNLASATVAFSPDGKRWRVVSPVDPVPYDAVVAARVHDAFVSMGSGRPTRLLEPDGSTSEVAPPPWTGSATYLGFTTPEVGMSVADGRLFRTTDGGATWTDITPR